MSGIDERDVARGGEDGHVEEPVYGGAARPGGATDVPTAPDDGGWPTTPAEIPLVAHDEDGREPLPAVEASEYPAHHRHSRNPVDRLTRGLPDPLRVIVDWAVTIIGAVAIVLLVKAFVVNPYRIPSSSMEPTLHCAQPASGCEARFGSSPPPSGR